MFASNNFGEEHEMRRLVVEMAARQMEGLKLYKPLPIGEAFHKSMAKERIARGANRVGKTLAACVEIARAITGQDPQNHYPQKDGICYMVGKDGREVSQVLYKKLFKPGAFRIIRDLDTKLWRAYDPYYPPDINRRALTKPAPPLVPRRMITDISWENKKEDLPKMVRLTTGWEVQFYTSMGKPPHGTDIDLALFDEEILDETWYGEIAARLIDRNGHFIWSATPQAGTMQLYRLHERAEDQAERKVKFPTVEEFLFTREENIHVHGEGVQLFRDKLDDEELAVREHGEFAFLAWKIYPEYSPTLHEVKMTEEIPSHWTRYVAIDPGHRIAAALFMAIPPPSEGDYGYVYDEIYIKDCDAVMFAQAMAQKQVGQNFWSFIIDNRAARQTEIASGRTIGEQYSEQLRRCRVSSHSTGSSFEIGGDNVRAGIEACRLWLKVIDGRPPRLRVVRDKCPNFTQEVRKYRKKRIGGVVIDEPESRKGNTHLMDCYDSQTEVLTRDGWQFFTDVTMDSEFATVNLRTNKIEYQFPRSVINQPHDGEMVKIEGRRTNALITPNHRMVVCNADGTDARIKTAGNLKNTDMLKLTAEWEGRSWEKIIIPEMRSTTISVQRDLDPGDWAEFLGWFVAEGFRAKVPQYPGRGAEVIICQMDYNPRYQDLIALTQRLPWNGRKGSKGIHYSSIQLWTALHGMGNTYTKRVPDWIKEASQEIIRRFLKGAMLGDGNEQPAGTWIYNTCNSKLADDVQELFLKTGRSASVLPKKAGVYNIRGRAGQGGPLYRTLEWQDAAAGLRRSDNSPIFEPVDYTGNVHCVSVDNGTLIVRRNGKPVICGNCLRYLVQANPQWHEVVKRVPQGSAAYRSLMNKQKEAGLYDSPINFGPGRMM